MSRKPEKHMSNLVNGVFQVVANEFPEVFNNAPPGSITPKKMQAVIDKLEDLMYDHLGEGPISIGAAHRINQIHNAGYTWQVGYSPEHKEYCVLHFNDTTPERADRPGAGYSTDSLYEAIRTAQKSMKEAENES